MNINLTINGTTHNVDISPGDSLLNVLRALGYVGVKHGCETGECGACTVLVDSLPTNACIYLAAQAEGHAIETVEALGEHPDQGWKTTSGLHRIQEEFVESGAIQCGYCTPAMLLAAKQLLDRNDSPSEIEVREAFSGILCRCTGYKKPIQAVLRAAAAARGEDLEPIDERLPPPQEWLGGDPGIAVENGEISPVLHGIDSEVMAPTQVMPKIELTPETEAWQRVGKPERKVDALKLVQGKPAFAADFERRGMLIAKVLHSPVAHARIKNINKSMAEELPGVAAVLTWQDIPRVVYSTAGQSDPIPGPLDSFSLDNKVRYVGDRVAFVAAENEEIALKALSLIEVDYEILAPLLDSQQ
ncbi:MAG: 2Fe-2S iron-sulfur cluster binding domain-containing protein, partial [Anaerolineales bacterium]|nr:2Fe-2S iron-sulfur cluster binding domain-containing protein [Anaerolineales bacterium]